MQNSEIVLRNRIFLMEQGILKGIPGTKILWKDDQGEREIPMPEEIFTFDAWKKRGYIVQKGQHAIAKFKIWLPKNGKKVSGDAEDGDDAEMEAKGFYKKMSYFFTADQVKAK